MPDHFDFRLPRMCPVAQRRTYEPMSDQRLWHATADEMNCLFSLTRRQPLLCNEQATYIAEDILDRAIVSLELAAARSP